MRRRWLLLAVILTVPSGCDNVSWGGVDMRLQPPPTAAVAPAVPAEEADAPVALPALPSGPILLAGTRDGDRATLVVVGEVRGDEVAPLPDEAEAPGYLDHFRSALLPPGTEMILFSEGVRVGRLTVTEAAVETRFCRPRPSVTGIVEVVPGAASAGRLVALLDSAAVRRPHGTFRVQGDEYDHRVASISMASRTLPQVGAEIPESLVEARADIRVLRLPEAQGPSVAATFLLRDELAVAPPRSGAYALFILGTQEAGEYRTSFAEYREAGARGKGAPRYFTHLDWDGDGDSEILLDVFGAETRWFAGLGQRGGTWVQTFQDPCGAPVG